MKMIWTLKRTVGFLYYKSGGKSSSPYMPLGTGSFARIEEGNLVFEYLVTCKHVVEQCPNDAQMFVRLNRSDKKNVEYIPLNRDWVYHPDKHIDLAVIHYKHPDDMPCDYEAVHVDNVFLPDKLLEEYISEGDPIAFIGLFIKVQGRRRNYPVYRFGHIAMVTDEKIKNGKYGYAQYILAECDAFPGNSGAPMYVGIRQSTKDNPLQQIVYILGIMTGSYLEQEIWVQGEKKPTTHHSRITLVVPITFVRDILYGDVLMNDRGKEVEGSII